MIRKYFISSLRKRKMRIILMVITLIFGVGILVALNATIDSQKEAYIKFISRETGDFDATIRKTTTDDNISIEEFVPRIKNSDNKIQEVTPRSQASVEMRYNDTSHQILLVGINQEKDKIGHADVVKGKYDLKDNQCVILKNTADTYHLKINNTLEIVRREFEEGVGIKEISRDLKLVGIITQNRMFDKGVKDAILADLNFTQDFLDISDKANNFLVRIDQNVYNEENPDTAVLNARKIGEKIRANLGADYSIIMPKAIAIEISKRFFLYSRGALSMYGIISLVVSAVLIYTLTMASVEEQTRIFAILRIIGISRRKIFSLVFAELLIWGFIGIILGLIFGIYLHSQIITPQLTKALGISVSPKVGEGTIIWSILCGFAILVISGFSPALKATKTKVMHAINPAAAASSVELEDISKIRERGLAAKLFFIGVILILIFTLMLYGSSYFWSFDIISAQVFYIFGGLVVQILSVSLIFFTPASAFERAISWFWTKIYEARGYFISRNLKRDKRQNSLVSLMIIFSITFTTYMGVELAMQKANVSNIERYRAGADIVVSNLGETGTSPTSMDELLQDLNPLVQPASVEKKYLEDSMVKEIEEINGVKSSAGITRPYRITIGDRIMLNIASVSIYGIENHSLREIGYVKERDFSEGGVESLDKIMSEKYTAVIPESLAISLKLKKGDELRIDKSGGRTITLWVAGIAKKIPGFPGFSSNTNRTSYGLNSILISADTFRDISEFIDQSIIDRIFVRTKSGADPEKIGSEINSTYRENKNLWVRVTQSKISEAMLANDQSRSFTLIITLLAMTIAIFGVFGTTYTSVYRGKREIGVLKAIGSTSGGILTIFLLGAMTMTLSATIAGIIAGTLLNYAIRWWQSLILEQPYVYTIDTFITPIELVLVIIATFVSAYFASIAITSKKAINILREALK